MAWQVRLEMEEATDDFLAAVGELREVLAQVMGPQLEARKAKLLFELLENQVDGMEKFYKLRLAEKDGITVLDEKSLYLITDKYVPLMRYFLQFPGTAGKSPYRLSIVSDFLTILQYHTREYGWKEER